MQDLSQVADALKQLGVFHKDFATDVHFKVLSRSSYNPLKDLGHIPYQSTHGKGMS